jgi:TRL (tRNA-associated locus)-like protein
MTKNGGLIMKKASIIFILSFTVLLSGCVALVPSPLTGFIYSDVKAPFPGMKCDFAQSPKMGESTAISILGWVAVGDASLETAAKSAGITKIHHVDFRSTNFFGAYATFTTIVYGE